MTLRDSMIINRSPSSAGGELTTEEQEKFFREAAPRHSFAAVSANGIVDRADLERHIRKANGHN